MNTNKTHECAACCGDGKVPYTHHRGWACVKPCPVCLGAGRISDVMPVSDSIADAETLRGSWEIVYEHTTGEFAITGLTERTTAHLWTSGFGGYIPGECAEAASAAARAAFRAVPGLR